MAEGQIVSLIDGLKLMVGWKHIVGLQGTLVPKCWLVENTLE
jgi:hypothetical protein